MLRLYILLNTNLITYRLKYLFRLYGFCRGCLYLCDSVKMLELFKYTQDWRTSTIQITYVYSIKV